MRHLLFIPLLFSAHASAQTKHDPFDFKMASVIILQSKEVQKELGISEAQRTQMNKYADKHRGELVAYQKQLEARQKDKNKPLDVDPTKMDGMFVNLKKGVFGQLKPGQLKRLREISLQQLGLVALIDETVATRVGLSVPEQKKIKSVYESGIKEADQIAQAGQAQLEIQLNELRKKYPNPKTDAEKEKVMSEAQKKAEAIEKRIDPQIESVRKVTLTKMLSMLSAKQRGNWTTLLGKPFK
ncbi:MAG TPA: hypothetical protein PKA27_00090 [Fimbriimonadaceae bacterium]|nr:hypothetical protein [Fimbriimonadaceae bacterium]